MNKATRMVALAAVMALIALFSVGTADAALAPWNPPCPTMTVNNNTPCQYTMTLLTVPAGVIPPFGVPANGTTTFTIPASTAVYGVVSSSGFNIPFLPGTTAPFPPAPLPSTWWIPEVTLPNGACCVDIYVDLGSCTMTILPQACRP